MGMVSGSESRWTAFGAQLGLPRNFHKWHRPLSCHLLSGIRAEFSAYHFYSGLYEVFQGTYGALSTLEAVT